MHWHYIDERGFGKIKKQAEREGGQLLILPPEAVADSGEDDALSIRTPGSSLHHKDMKSP